MKYLFTFLLTLSAFCGNAQWCSYHFSFEVPDTIYQDHFVIDTANGNNIWQIGIPNKAIFNSAHSSPNVIVTDTVNDYPDNDTSTFTIVAYRAIGQAFLDISFWHQLSIDPGDTAIVEVSADSGTQWMPIEAFPPLVNTNGWEHFYGSCNLTLDPDPYAAKDVYFRFTFISDSVLSAKEGWMIDDICILFWWEGAVRSVYNNELIHIYPNPSDGHIQLKPTSTAQHTSLQVSNMNGQRVYETNSIPSDGNMYLPLPDGMYILRYADEQDIAVKRLVIQH